VNVDSSAITQTKREVITFELYVLNDEIHTCRSGFGFPTLAIVVLRFASCVSFHTGGSTGSLRWA
jgi:hypothetical protein